MKIIHLITFLAMGGKIAAFVRRSVEGERILIEDAPYFVSIRHNGVHVCAGALVSNDVVVTLLPCLLSVDVTLVTGVDENNPNGTVHGLKTFTVENILNIASAILSDPIVFNDVEDSVKMPLAEPLYYEKVHLITFRPETAQLRRYEVRMAPWFQCSNDEKTFCVTRISDSGIQEDEKGSPLVYDGSLMGIASPRLSLDDDYDVYIDFHKHLEGLAQSDDGQFKWSGP